MAFLSLRELWGYPLNSAITMSFHTFTCFAFVIVFLSHSVLNNFFI